ncbi:hypothetical protein FQZ97_378480 [compost metagenome]
MAAWLPAACWARCAWPRPCFERITVFGEEHGCINAGIPTDRQPGAIRSALRQPDRASVVQPPVPGRAALHTGHRRAGRFRPAGGTQCQLPQDHSQPAPLHPQLPALRKRSEGPGQCRAHRGRGAAQRGHLLAGLPRRAQGDQRRGLPAARRRPRFHEVFVDALGALDRGDRRRLRGRPGAAGRLRRLACQHRRRPRQRAAFGGDRAIGGAGLPLVHPLLAADGAGRPAPGLRRAVRAPGRHPRALRGAWRHAAHHRLRQGDG